MQSFQFLAEPVAKAASLARYLRTDFALLREKSPEAFARVERTRISTAGRAGSLTNFETGEDLGEGATSYNDESVYLQRTIRFCV